MRHLFTLLLLCLSVQADDYLVLSVNSSSYATNISAMIWELAVPGARTNANLTTKYWTGFVQHQDGRVALVIPNDDVIKLSVNADENAIPNALLAAGILNVLDAAELKADILANKGKSVHVREHIPLAKLGNLKTRQQAEADGWFP